MRCRWNFFQIITLLACGAEQQPLADQASIFPLVTLDLPEPLGTNRGIELNSMDRHGGLLLDTTRRIVRILARSNGLLGSFGDWPQVQGEERWQSSQVQNLSVFLTPPTPVQRRATVCLGETPFARFSWNHDNSVIHGVYDLRYNQRGLLNDNSLRVELAYAPSPLLNLDLVIEGRPWQIPAEFLSRPLLRQHIQISGREDSDELLLRSIAVWSKTLAPPQSNRADIWLSAIIARQSPHTYVGYSTENLGFCSGMREFRPLDVFAPGWCMGGSWPGIAVGADDLPSFWEDMNAAGIDQPQMLRAINWPQDMQCPTPQE